LQLSGARIAELKSKDALSRQSANSLHSESSPVSVSTAKIHTEQRGPRIKHVCRRAAVVFGERATFPLVHTTTQLSSSEINLSALPSHEKKHVVQLSAEGLFTKPVVAVLLFLFTYILLWMCLY